MQNEIYIQTYWYQIYAMHVDIDIYMREILANALPLHVLPILRLESFFSKQNV